MDIDRFLELARSRRSTRRFKPDPVSAEDVRKILEASRWAMSGANGQPWEFLLITSEDTKKKLGEIYRKYDETTMAVELTRLQEYRQPRFRTASPLETPWELAPVIIGILGDSRTMQASTLAGRLYEAHVFDQNLANATHMLHLAAAALGLGSQWLSVFPPHGEEMKALLGIPPLITLFTLNPIGHPESKRTSYRRDLDDLIHYENYDRAKLRSNSAVVEFVKSLRQHHAQAISY